MSYPDFPTGGTTFKEGNLCVRYFGDASASTRFLTGAKKDERKLRYIEFVRSENRYFLLVHKVKKNSTVPFFKIEICGSSVIRTSDRFAEFRFWIDNEDVAVFDHEDSNGRNDWVEILNGAITSINAKNPSSMLGSSSPGIKRTISSHRNPSPIYARSAINTDAGITTPGRLATPSATPSTTVPPPVADSQPSSSLPLTSRSRGLYSNASSVGLTEPVRKIQKHVDSIAMSASGRSTPEPKPSQSVLDGDDELARAPGQLLDESTATAAHLRDNSLVSGLHRVDVPPFSLSPEMKVKRAVHSPSSGISGLGPGGGGEGEVHSLAATRMRTDSEVDVSKVGIHTEPALSALPAASVLVTTTNPSDLALSEPVPISESSEHDDTNNMSVGVLLHETQALSAMNDELNEALERTESLLRASEEDHAYQMAHLRALLEKAQIEPNQLRAELAEALEEKESAVQALSSTSEEIDLLQTEIRDLKAEKTASEHVIHNQQDVISEYEEKYSERNVDRITHLEEALSAVTQSLAERDAEVEELTNQLDAYRSMIREKEEELRAEPMHAHSAEMSAMRVEMQKEIDAVQHLLDRKDQEFLSDLSGTFASQVKAKLVPLSLNTKKLTMDLAAAQAAEESQRASRAQLENVVAQQEAFIEQKLLLMKADAHRAAELAQEVTMYKEDARSAALQREQAARERDEATRRVTVLERELAAQREALHGQLEAAQEELFKQRAHSNKVGIEETHLVRPYLCFA